MSNEQQAARCDAKSVLALALGNDDWNAKQWQLISQALKAAEGTRP
ncbi:MULTISPECIES: hypothetical protein [Pseudomonas]|nr:hypothetical protein [Pseudomonas putida]